MVLLDRAVHIFQFVVWNCSLGTIDCKGLLTAEDKKGEKSLQLCVAKSPCKHQPDKKRKTSALWMEFAVQLRKLWGGMKGRKAEKSFCHFLIVCQSPFWTPCLCRECWGRKCNHRASLLFFYLCDILQKIIQLSLRPCRKGNKTGKLLLKSFVLVI